MPRLPESKNKPIEEGLLLRLLKSFRRRYRDLVAVIDDAFNSENLKDRIWAFEQSVKLMNQRGKSGGPEMPVAVVKKNLPDVSTLSDEALLREIRALLKTDSPEELTE